MDLDEVVAFATVSGSSTHYTQSPNHKLTPPQFPSPLSPKPRLNLTQPTPTKSITTPFHPSPNHPRPSQSHTTSYSPTKTFHLSIYPSIHLHTDAYTLTRLIVNKLLTLYIYYIFLLTYWLLYDIIRTMKKGLFIC